MATLTQEMLKELLHYDPETGMFTWLKPPRYMISAGDMAGYINYGYRIIGVLGTDYRAHRLAWLYMKGEWPKEDIDHKNNIRDDNRWTNLREAKNSINQENLHKPYKNNRSGFLGVSIDNGKYYVAKIQVNKKQYRIGVFHTPELAHAAYVNTKRKLHRGCSI